MSVKSVSLRIARCLICVASLASAAAGSEAAAERIPRPDHVVIVVEENRTYRQIIDHSAAPYINGLARHGVLFTQSFAVAYPSQPNYLALFSGSTHGVRDNSCPNELTGDNLASELLRRGLSFAIYSESLPAPGYRGCDHEHYVRKHNPVANWKELGASPGINLPFTSFPTDFRKLPTVSLVVPDQRNNMHDDTSAAGVRKADRWLYDNLNSFAEWAQSNNSLLILTFDEDDRSAGNHIPTIFVGPMVKRGIHDKRITHYNVLRTLIEMYDLRPMGEAKRAKPIQGIWAGQESE